MTLLLSGTNGVSDVDGTAATPAIRGSDTNTGIFFPSADTIAFAEGGVESARFDASGNLGVGTTSPAPAVSRRGFVLRGSSSGAELIVQSTSATDGTSDGMALVAAGTDCSIINRLNGFMTFNTNNTERMRIDSAGRVTTPFQPAFLAGKTSSTTNNSVIVFNDALFNIGGHYNTSNGRFTAPISGVYQFSWQILGNTQQTIYRSTLRRNGSTNVGGGFQAQMRMDGNVANYFDTSTTYTIILQLTAGDFVDIFYASDNGVATINDGSYWEKFMGHLIG